MSTRNRNKKDIHIDQVGVGDLIIVEYPKKALIDIYQSKDTSGRDHYKRCRELRIVSIVTSVDRERNFFTCKGAYADRDGFVRSFDFYGSNLKLSREYMNLSMRLYKAGKV